MKLLPHLFEQNKSWAEAIKLRAPEFFQKLSRQQNPNYLWIGCADSRVPANGIIGLMPGGEFLHSPDHRPEPTTSTRRVPTCR